MAFVLSAVIFGFGFWAAGKFKMAQGLDYRGEPTQFLGYEQVLIEDTRITALRYRDWETDRKSTRLNSSHSAKSRMPSSA